MGFGFGKGKVTGGEDQAKSSVNGGANNGGANQSTKAGNSKRNAGVAAVLDKNTKNLPNIIASFRNDRLSLGYDDPTYFGFALDIHSQETESESIYNPYTGLRANPLFYRPQWAGSSLAGDGPVNTGKNLPKLLADASEACALQYLNSFSLTLDKTIDEIAPTGVLLNKAAAGLSNPLRPSTNDKLTRGFYLAEFIKILNTIQEKTPWTFNELDGIPNLWKAVQAGHDYKPVELTITANETVDLRITRLAETYRMLSWDSYNGRKILPPNLEKFSMDIYFMDLRFLKNADSVGIPLGNLVGSSSATYDNTFSAQVNFGGVAFRCMGCRFDFSGLLENSTQVKASIGEGSGHSVKFKIIVDRVMPASYFGDKAFGIAPLAEEPLIPIELVNAVGGALNLGPFTGGVNRVLSAGRRALSNILGAPQRALNDALLGLQRKFESGVDNFLENNQVSSRPFEKKSVESLLNERKGSAISNDVFPGKDTRTAAPIKQDVFPGQDARQTKPIIKDFFPGKDTRTAAPIKQDVFPGQDGAPIGKIATDVFPGDVPVLTAINQRKVGGKISSQNPFKP